jgi:hypothetical protein
MADSNTTSRPDAELGSKDLTTASTRRGRLGYNTRGFCEVFKSSAPQHDIHSSPITLRIINAMSCMIELRYSGVLGWRISSDIVVINNGVLLEAICKTAARAVDATLRLIVSLSLRAAVANVKSERRISMAST